MKTAAFAVPTKTLIAQGQATLNDWQAPATAERRRELAGMGLSAQSFEAELRAALGTLTDAEVRQERKKAEYVREAHEDQAIAEEGYRYKLSMEARARAHIAEHGDELELVNKLRFGHLRVARARGVAYELRTVLPELVDLNGALAAAGIDAAFIERGWDILRRLGVETKETATVKAERGQLTQVVRGGELALSRLLHRLESAEEAIVVENPVARPMFRLDIVATELARLEAGRKTRVNASSDAVPDEE